MLSKYISTNTRKTSFFFSSNENAENYVNTIALKYRSQRIKYLRLYFLKQNMSDFYTIL